VAKVCPNLVARDSKGQIFTVRYEQVNAMLLNEFLKEHQKVETQQKEIAGLQEAVAEQKKMNVALAAGLDAMRQQVARVVRQTGGTATPVANGLDESRPVAQ
jgi:predicted RNase H-like nuclease (RuvC/YqgF family)